MRGYEILRRHGVPVDILCVVGAHNVRRPAEVYGFFKSIGASYVSFLPLVERRPGAPGGVSPESVPAEAWGDFLCAVFDEWLAGDIGRIKVQVIEEAARTAFGQEHSLCIFRPVCGDIPVLERNGDLYPATTSWIRPTAWAISARRRSPRSSTARPRGPLAWPNWKRCPAFAWSATSGRCATANAPRTASLAPRTANRD